MSVIVWCSQSDSLTVRLFVKIYRPIKICLTIITLNCQHNLNDIITKITSCFTLEILVIKELCLEMMNYHHDIMVMQPEISEIERK